MRQLLFLILIFFGVGLVVRLSQTAPGERPVEFLPVTMPEAGILSRQEPEVETEPIAELLLPDLQVLTPRELYISNLATGRSLRFSTTFFNQGLGPMEVIGHHDETQNITYAAQYVKQAGGPGVYRDIGRFVQHPTHDHWHVEGWAQYQLWSVKDTGERDKLLITSDKHSFCIWDENSHNLSWEGAPQSRQYFYTCNRRVQGMSVGWSDTYRARVDGQEMDLGGIEDGTYIFRSIINPDQAILESDYSNNESQIYLEITGTRLSSRESF